MRLSSPGVHRLRRRLGALGWRAARQFLQENVNLGEQVVLVLLPWLHRLERTGKRALRRPYGEFGCGFPGAGCSVICFHTGEIFAPPGVVQGVTEEDHRGVLPR